MNQRWISFRKTFLASLACLIVAITPHAYGEQPEAPPISPSQTTDTSPSRYDWWIEQHDSWSNSFHDMVSSIDRYIAGDNYERLEHNSYLRLRLGARWDESDGVSEDGDLKVRLDLPSIKQRWNLFIENQLDERETLESTNREDEISPTSDDDSFYGGISRERDLENWYLRPELGLRLRAPLDPFARLKARRMLEMNSLWNGQFQQSIYYFHSDGFGTRVQLMFSRPAGDSFQFQVKSEAQWQDDTHNTDLAQVFTLQQYLEERSTLTYELGFLGETKPSVRSTEHYFNLRYRQPLYKDKLYLDIVPAVNWPRDEDFEPKLSLTARIEILFSK
ncbi:hypothetical protein QKW35_14660 [Pontibacterium granulatum]|uniref:hypothetical protein n=1 Tax=Pontibacterium granulatum TaxID=2036029 RepID=UPI00249AAA00|nr:hypothetical protein [Pontibacterium granulatum]MDI3325617.1 hypothetical protein [Pontibacterium granulatum]